ncbi:MAG: hypothetical protein WCD79_09625 [Chthoniobacteraceae bacterium]
MITIQPRHEDDPSFLDQVRWIVAGCVDQYKPAEVYIIRIRDLFDYKWCYFSGKTLGTLGVHSFYDLTLPPFVPGRVICQDHYERVEADGGIYKASDAPLLHIHQRSEANLKRVIRKTTNQGTIFWYSSGSTVAGRGSLMVYNVSPSMKFGWHVMFLKKSIWQIEKVTFISKPLVEGLRASGCDKMFKETSALA